jgi:hypothetical protein
VELQISSMYTYPPLIYFPYGTYPKSAITAGILYVYTELSNVPAYKSIPFAISMNKINIIKYINY